MNTPTVIIRLRLISEACAECGAVSGESCVQKFKGGKVAPIFWTHARGSDV